MVRSLNLLIMVVCMLLMIELSQPHGAHHQKKQETQQIAQQRVLMISFDGFRHDYIERARRAHRNVSTFDRVFREGAHAAMSKVAFVTKTAPNHYTLVTGLFEQSHGIVSNKFFDAKLNASFNLLDAACMMQGKWFGGETVWTTNQRNGFLSASVYWVGDAAVDNPPRNPPRNQLPTFNMGVFSNEPTLRYRLNRVLNWLVQFPQLTLATVYWPNPDHMGHQFGPDSPQVMDSVQRINAELDYLVRRIDANPQLNRSLNLIVTSDHGMTKVSSDRLIQLSHYLQRSDLSQLSDSCDSFKDLWPKPEKEREIIEKLSKVAHMQVYRRDEIPRAYHYRSSRVSPVFLAAQLGYTICWNATPPSSFDERGNHGYNNSELEMKAIFMARGPAIKRGASIRQVYSVDVYSLIAHLIGWKKTAPTNGTLERMRWLLNTTFDEARRRNETWKSNKNHSSADEQDDWSMMLTLATIICVISLTALIASSFTLIAIRQTRQSTVFHPSHSSAAQSSSSRGEGGGGAAASYTLLDRHTHHSTQTRRLLSSSSEQDDDEMREPNDDVNDDGELTVNEKEEEELLKEKIESAAVSSRRQSPEMMISSIILETSESSDSRAPSQFFSANKNHDQQQLRHQQQNFASDSTFNAASAVAPSHPLHPPVLPHSSISSSPAFRHQQDHTHLLPDGVGQFQNVPLTAN